MLVVTLRDQEFITLRINNRIIKITIKKHRPLQTRVGVIADDEVRILRGEHDLKSFLELEAIHEERKKEKGRLLSQDWGEGISIDE